MPGSGKSTIGKMLAEKLGYKQYSMGDLRGRWAIERGLTIDELNKLGEQEDWTDKDADAYQEKLGKTEDNFVIDGRLSFHFIPQAFKIFLTVDPRVAAQRVIKNPRPDEKLAASVEELMAAQQARVENDERRYEKYYKLSFQDKSNYDLVIDTTDLTPGKILDRIMARLKS
ncbi:hypothetical protein A3B21_00965 [Candidatus Uhrbacteria bacterium RIFCSPLOWO2_01_FULL_47_24]|uniref:(d)CMP kinase n=1 Tax=Candidatus Uhrbacteria bacterium RIFCSPLOWO2_01_FULL_47_24 TaxID=1802401 RepID=A0A1F7UNT9_9BACT|nr:MAG: hypothetical protein A3B21_00965 [Candidatus Uhrbacteria bacterium RIFCSPLOWO2_01_FULL_47_24]